MDFERAGEIWRREAGGAPGLSLEEQLAAVRGRAAKLARSVRRRDRIETGVALAMLPFFAWQAATAEHPLSGLGAAIVAAACVLIPVRLRMARRRPADPGQPVALALRAELARVRAQEQLLGSVAWWYVGPLGLGVVLAAAGGPAPPLVKGGYAAAVVAAAAYVLHLNRRAVRDELRPVAKELEGWLAALHEPLTDDDSDAN